jgi:hypothetical protein
MNAIADNSRLKKNVLTWLELLDHDTKLDIIVYLSESLKKEVPTKKSNLASLYGAWNDEISAEELVKEIKETGG